jgi:integrase
MPNTAKGHVTLRDGVWETRITLQGQNKKTFKLPTCRAEEDAQERSALLAQQAKRLRQSRHLGSKAADVLLDELALARPGAVADVLQVIGELCGGVGVAEPPKPTGPTFSDVAKAWLSGELHDQFPHHIDTPSEDWAALVRQRLDRAVYPVIGDIPIAKLTREHCDDVMRRLPIQKGKEQLEATTLRQYAGLLTRVLNLAEIAGYIDRTPLPRGWLPKPSARKRFPILLPAEDSKLLGTTTIPLVWRLFYGFLHREGVRREEAVELRWSDIDLVNGMVSLDENKTNHPRWWKLDKSVAASLKAWHDMQPEAPEPTDRVFEDSGVSLALDRMADRIRADLAKAEFIRADLTTKKGLKRPFGTHCFRRSFVTRNLALGRNEDWVRRQTGHESDEILRYRQEAKELAHAGVHELEPLFVAVPELHETLDETKNHREDGGIGRRARFRFWWG